MQEYYSFVNVRNRSEEINFKIANKHEIHDSTDNNILLQTFFILTTDCELSLQLFPFSLKRVSQALKV